jgi:hypothetical protein
MVYHLLAGHNRPQWGISATWSLKSQNLWPKYDCQLSNERKADHAYCCGKVVVSGAEDKDRYNVLIISAFRELCSLGGRGGCRRCNIIVGHFKVE